MRLAIVGVLGALSLIACSAPQPEQTAVSAPAAEVPPAASAAPPTTDEGMITSAMSAAPEAVARDASVMTVDDKGAMKHLREGSNGWTCMPDVPTTPGTDPMCVDANGLEWAEAWMARRYREGDIRRVIAAEHTGLLERDDREKLEQRFKASGTEARPWYENLLSATPTLEMGVDIGSLSTLLLCSVPPSQASFLQ